MRIIDARNIQNSFFLDERERYKEEDTYQLVVGVEFVDYRIPESVKLLDRVVILEREIVSTFVSSREFLVNSSKRVKGLVDVSEIVDEETESIGSATLFILLYCVHDSGVDKGVLVSSRVAQPVNDVRDHNRDVLGVKMEIRIVTQAPTIAQVGNVHEVPARLPTATLVLDHVGKRCCFNERMILLAAGQVFSSHHSEQCFGLLKGLWALLEQVVVGHSCNCKKGGLGITKDRGTVQPI
jgi:hypothetical protein